MFDVSPIARPFGSARSDGASSHSSSEDAPRIAVIVLILLPLIFNAVALLPEATHSTPSANDQVFHYLFIERANQAIEAGDNPFDHWLPELELGFPQFFYYQNLPHLMVVGLHRALFERVGLLRLLNLTRYLLMVSFPLTVYWSMRRMEFSKIAAAVGAALSPMLSSRARYGFDFHSYVWGGSGMFTQLFAMHLLFVGSACVRRVIERGQDFTDAILASSAIVLSDLLFGYIFATVVAILLLLSVFKALTGSRDLRAIASQIGTTVLRLAIVFVPVTLITAYQTVPFFRQIRYLNQTFLEVPNAQPPLFSLQIRAVSLSSFSPFLPLTPQQLWMFFGGHFFDDNRLPVVTSLVAIGIIYGLMTRRAEAKFALTTLAACMVLCMPGPLRIVLDAYLPYLTTMPWFRFVSGVDFAAILVGGLAGECIWRWCWARTSNLRIIVPAILLVVLYTPLIVERWSFYQINENQMELTDHALQADHDLPSIMSALRNAPPGRVYAGTRANWGAWMRIGSVHLYDLLPVEQFDTVMPWQTLSLNAPLLWELDVPSSEQCRLFNIRYVIAPPGMNLPDSYHPMLSTSSYVLYQADSGGYMQLGRIGQIAPTHSSEEVFRFNNQWAASSDPAQGRFIAYLPPGQESDPGLRRLLDSSLHTDQTEALGSITDASTTPDSFDAHVTARFSAVLIIKATYHPNWHVTVDGREQPTFMVSPSYIGIAIEPGFHEVRAEYRSSRLKKMLLILSAIVLSATIATAVYERRISL